MQAPMLSVSTIAAKCSLRFTYVYDAFNCPKHGSHGLANEWHSAEKTRLANEDVEKLLVDLDKLLSD